MDWRENFGSRRDGARQAQNGSRTKPSMNDCMSEQKGRQGLYNTVFFVILSGLCRYSLGDHMVSFWSSSAVLQATSRLENLRQAEAKLLQFAQRYSPTVCSIQAFDTVIPRSCISSLKPNKQEGDELTIRGIIVKEQETSTKRNKTKIPLVALHGYYNGAAYFYRNLAGLASQYETVYSLDWLGWGLSSRPDFRFLQKRHTVESTEEFFVESLEAWRRAQGIDKMILCGHSMGGYMSVAYCERYPQHVEQLLLLSPVGVPDETDPSFLERRERFTSDLRSRMFLGVFQTLFDWTTVGSVLRSYMSPDRAYGMVNNYVTRRLPQIEAADERQAITDYLYYNAVSPGSGEHAIHSILNSNVMAKRPLVHRIPQLAVKTVRLFYGEYDWMDMSGALSTQRICEDSKMGSGDQHQRPNIKVFMIPKAGHLLMLENSRGTTSALIQAGGGQVPPDDRPVLIEPGVEPLPDSQIRRAAKTRHYQEEIRRQVAVPSRNYPPPEVSME